MDKPRDAAEGDAGRAKLRLRRVNLSASMTRESDIAEGGRQRVAVERFGAAAWLSNVTEDTCPGSGACDPRVRSVEGADATWRWTFRIRLLEPGVPPAPAIDGSRSIAFVTGMMRDPDTWHRRAVLAWTTLWHETRRKDRDGRNAKRWPRLAAQRAGLFLPPSRSSRSALATGNPAARRSRFQRVRVIRDRTKRITAVGKTYPTKGKLPWPKPNTRCRAMLKAITAPRRDMFEHRKASGGGKKQADCRADLLD